MKGKAQIKTALVVSGIAILILLSVDHLWGTTSPNRWDLDC